MRRERRGVTLIEQVLALTILSVGLLAVSSAGDALHRGARHALLRAETASTAAGWRERLVASGCASARAGEATEGPLDLAWSGEQLGASVVLTVRATERDDGASGANAEHETIGAVRCVGG